MLLTSYPVNKCILLYVGRQDEISTFLFCFFNKMYDRYYLDLRYAWLTKLLVPSATILRFGNSASDVVVLSSSAVDTY